jgi:hypothetical protein
MNISPEHKPLRLHRPWLARPPVLIGIALLAASAGAFALAGWGGGQPGATAADAPSLRGAQAPAGCDAALAGL